MLVTYFVLLTLAAVAYGQCDVKPQVDPSKCCPFMPRGITPQVIRECEMKPTDSFNLIPCENINCIMRKVNMVGPDNKVDRANVMNYLKSQYGPEWDSVLTSTVPICIQQIDSMPGDCEARQFAMCMNMKLVAACPPNLWTSTPECEATKNYLNNCS